MSQALYRKYRSKSLSEIVGQEHVTQVLAQAIALGKVAHAYLLTGPRGVGKTSIARILAHEINQLPYTDGVNHLDIIEIDAASNNGIEDVRELREKVQIAPVSAKRKIYIIDEVHMLSKAAFNALLKTLEEPPSHVVFILATTDAEKLPQTIISRTQRFSFRTISPADAVKHLAHIAKEEGIAIEPDALELIAIRGDGSFRDSISLLDQLSGLGSGNTAITRSAVEQALGLAPSEQVEQLLEAYHAKDLAKIVQLLQSSEDAGVQPEVLASQLINSVKSQLVEKPQLLPLLDSLLEVARSSKPGIKLLVVLAVHAVPKAKTAALRSSTPTVSASIETLQKKPAQQPSKTIRTELSSKEKLVVKEQPAAKENELTSTPPAPTGELDWGKLLGHTREHFVAIHSVLSKCGHEFNGETLTIYTGNAFYKKKLDDAKYRINLTKSLVATGAGEPAIDTIPTPPPPKDGLAASVAAIMGGGEEVSVGEEATASA